MNHEQITLRCEDGQEAVVFTKYHFYTNNNTNDFNYEFTIEDSYTGGDYKGFFGRLRRAWRAFWDKPVVYTGIYCEDKGKMRKFLTDCLNLVENKSYMFPCQAINLLFHIANNISKITEVEEEQEVYLQAIEKAIESLKNSAESRDKISVTRNTDTFVDDSVTSNEELIKKGEW